MSQPATQRSGHFWKWNIWDKFTQTLVKSEGGFRSQREAKAARSVALKKIREEAAAKKPFSTGYNPAKDKRDHIITEE